MKWDKNTFLNLSQQTDDVGMTSGFNESRFLSPQHFNEAIFLQISPLRYMRRGSCADLFRSVEISGLWPDSSILWAQCCPDDVKVDFAPGLCPMSRSIHDSHRILWPRSDIRPRVHKCVGPWSVLAGWYQASGCLQSVKLCWECLQRISSLLALGKCLLYKY